MAGVALASTASADDAGMTPSVQSGTVTIAAPTRTVTERTTVTKQHWISYDDCDKDAELTFSPKISGSATSSSTLSAYISVVGQDCLLAETRAIKSVCKQVTVTNPTTLNPIVHLKAKDLTALFGISGCGESLADGGAQGADGISLKFYFLLDAKSVNFVDGTNSFAIYEDSGIDLWGPEPPTGLAVESGDEALQVTFVDGTNTDSDRAGYRFFIDDGEADAGAPVSAATSGAGPSTSVGATTSAGVGGSTSSSASAAGSGGGGGATSSSASSGAGGGGGGGASSSSSSSSTASSSSSSSSAGVGGAGGSGASGTTAATTGSAMSMGVTSGGNTDACSKTVAVAECTPASSVLIAGEKPTFAGTGDIVETGTVGTVSKLTNGKAYVVAMAAYDDVGNVGKLSELRCGTPAPVDSILRVYQCKGGLTESGCGFCSVGGERGGSFAALVSAGLVMLGFAARRSRRPRTARTSRGAR